MRLFASDRVASIMERLKWPEEEAIEAKIVTKAVQNAQGQIEELNYERRKNVLKYDEVMNGQRPAIYADRRKILDGEDMHEKALAFVADAIEATVATYCPPEVFAEEWDREGLRTALAEIYPSSLTEERVAEIGDAEALQAAFLEDALAAYAAKEEAVGAEMMRELERVVLLNIIDTRWREHLYEMDYLQEGIYLRSYAQKDPITEYRREAFDMFEELTSTIQTEFVRYIYRVELVRPEQQQRRAAARARRPGPGAPRRRRGRRGVGLGAGGEPEPGDQRQGATERALPLRQRSEVQEVPRRRGLRPRRPDAEGGRRVRAGPFAPAWEDLSALPADVVARDEARAGSHRRGELAVLTRRARGARAHLRHLGDPDARVLEADGVGHEAVP